MADIQSIFFNNRNRRDRLYIHKGVIPGVFTGLDDSLISFCHVDVDAYRSVQGCCDYVWPRLAMGGFMVFDDYGCPDCLGAKQAVDDYFRGKAYPILATGSPSTHSAVVFRSISI
jgi:O-methyltransferase